MGIKRAFKISQAFFTAAPFRSVPADAAVADVFGTLSVLVGITRICSGLTPSSCAAIAATLVCKPWPISVPPWFTCTVPSW